jgi:probable F420-dependent oxidoreductase
MTHPFHFVATPALTITHASRDDFIASLRRMEDVGIGTVALADHFTEGWTIEPFVGLTAAAMTTSTLRLQTAVLGNDYRHPVLTHRSAALLDVLSNGRLTVGLGAGWLQSDYDSAGIPQDAPAIRVARLQEAVAVIKGLFGDKPFTFAGAHYRVTELDGLPKPVQQPHPPILIGGGSPRVLRFAGAAADIVGINASLRAGALGAHAVTDLEFDRVADKVAWVREGADGAGRSLPQLAMNIWLLRVTGTESDAAAYIGKVAGRYGVEPQTLRDSPSVLVGTVQYCIDTLTKRRERLGFSYWQLDAGMSTTDLDAVRPIVERLAGT